MLVFSFIVALLLCLQIIEADPSWRSGENIDIVFGLEVGALPTEVYAAGYSNTDGGIVYYSGDRANKQPSQTWKVGGKNYDISLSADNTTLCVVGSAGIFTGPSRYFFTPTKSNAFSAVVAQEVRPFGSKGFAVIGRFTNSLGGITNGVAISTDLGVTWKAYGLGLSREKGYYARFGSFPSENTWYITSGNWPNNNDGKLLSDTALRVSGRISVYLDTGSDEPAVTFMSARKLLGTYPGAISKTTNGGKNFKKVLDSNGEYYYNQIDCFSENNCFVIGENGKKAIILKTTDGGDTWTNVMTLNGPYSLHAVRMISDTEVFVAGGHPSVGPYVSKEIQGTYYHTIDGGANWDLTTFNGYGYDLSFKGGNGYAISIFKKRTDIWIYS